MKKKVLSLVVVISLLLTVLVFSGCTEDEEKVIIGTSADFPPFEYTEDGDIVGFDVDVIKSILKDQGYKVEIEDMSFSSLIPALKQKKIDVVAAAMTITDERDKKIDFSKPYYEADQSIIVKSGSGIQIDKPQDLQNYTVGAQTGTTGAGWIKENLIKNGTMSEDDFDSYDTYTLAVNDLANERIDAVVLDKPVAKAFEQDKDVKIIKTIETGEEYGFGVREESTDLLEDINKGLDNIKGSEEWNNYVDKYLKG